MISTSERIQLHVVERRWIGIEGDAVQIVVLVVQLLVLRATLLQLQNKHVNQNELTAIFNIISIKVTRNTLFLALNAW